MWKPITYLSITLSCQLSSNEVPSFLYSLSADTVAGVLKIVVNNIVIGACSNVCSFHSQQDCIILQKICCALQAQGDSLYKLRRWPL